MNKAIKLMGCLILLALQIQAQSRVTTSRNHLEKKITHRTCGSGVMDIEYEKWLQPLIKLQEQNRNKGAAVVYNIPVVFHVIHGGSAVGVGLNISDAQINSQIAVLNEDFKKLNADTSTIPGVFTGVAANCEINFCLAQTNPQGGATNGINRVHYNTFGGTTPPFQKSYIDATIKPNTIWNTNNYLNIWVVPDYKDGVNDILGHATFPAGSGLSGLTAPFGTTTTDGVVVWYRSCGRIGNVQIPYHKGRTATHEIGHWLGLRHIWGDNTCGNDFCGDTPTQQSANFGCPSFPHVTCSNGPNGDMFMNFMDYGDDLCLKMFTTDQKSRIQTVMSNSPMRVALSQSTVCNPPTAAAPVADFSANTTTIAAGGSINFTDLSTNIPTGWAWTFTGGNPSISSSQNPTNIVYATPGTYDVSLVATNGTGSDTETKLGYITVNPTGTLACDTITNFDLLLHTPSILGSLGWGYVTGHNDYLDIAKADKYTIIGTNQTIDGAYFAFGIGSSSGTGQTATVTVWDNDGAAGVPNTVLGTATVTYDSIAAGAAAGSLTWVDFVPNIAVNGDVYVGIQFIYNPGDTLAIVHCDDGEIVSGTGWEKWANNTWHPYSEPNTGWDIEVAQLILPVICPFVGVQENSPSFKMNLFPNPANTNLNVVIPKQMSNGNIHVRVLTTLGANVLSDKLNFVQNGIYKIDISSLSSGFYFIEVLTDYGRQVEKFQVSK
ncbi:MAG: PKD domain-containing protein [Bacteroidetes bacterium]|nr:PKD domain-containing protein [Bacteroidota bacterium]